LSVKHIALIDDMTLNFHSGLTAITGETGAGKSMVLESLQLLFGKRSDQDMIRHGFDEAVVLGVFELKGETITIERRLSSQSKHQMKLNGETVTLAKIREVASAIGHIHNQDDLYELIDPKSYIHLLDTFDQKALETIRIDYLLSKSSYEDALKKKQHIIEQHETKQKQDDLIKFQIQELEALQLTSHILEDTQEELQRLKHYDAIASHYHNLEALFETSEVIHQLYQIKQEIQSLSTYIHAYEKMQETMDNVYYEIDDIKSTILNDVTALDFDSERFEMLQQREFDLIKIQQKYQKTIPELIDYLDTLKMDQAMFDDYEGLIQTLDQDIQKKKDIVLNDAHKLTQKRNEVASMIEKALIERLLALDLSHVSFQIDVIKTDTMLESGMDDVIFNISLNEGEPLKPLHKVASGGERSRFMFALKSLQALYQGVSMLVLDEIDTGISGKTASKVANQMALLSNNLQVIVITHVPQVAAKANTHLKVYKETIDQRIQTFVEMLDEDARIKEIAAMLSDETMSTFAIEQAKMLLNQKKDKH
ncbi:MAG: DNA repair protein RecN, partial [Acholeplasmataceae bacterium]